MPRGRPGTLMVSTTRSVETSITEIVRAASLLTKAVGRDCAASGAPDKKRNQAASRYGTESSPLFRPADPTDYRQHRHWPGLVAPRPAARCRLRPPSRHTAAGAADGPSRGT